MNLSFPTEDTIAAIATAVSTGHGGIAIIRISGQSAEAVAKQVVNIPGDPIWRSHQILYGHVLNQSTNQCIDEVLVLIMQGPRSFTGEDVIEIHCHGGLIAVHSVLEQVLMHPKVRRANPGEFSQRAVLNGRLDLSQAEALNDLISSRSQKAAQLAIAGMEGNIHKQVKALRNKLLDELCEIEARIDFEEEMPILNQDNLKDNLLSINCELKKLIGDTKKVLPVRNGLKIALIGLPNVGKSSLLNLLSKTKRAIVTEFPGTTRDFLEIQIVLEGIPVTLIDTAGIRATDDIIEKIGINRTQEVFTNADVVVLIFDMHQGWTVNDEALLNQIPPHIPRLIVGNKADISLEKPLEVEPDVTLSALTGLREKDFINSLLQICNIHTTEGIELALNERQLDLVILASSALDQTLKAAEEKLPWDFWTIDLRDSIQKLGEITGDDVSEAVLDRIFSRFCIGK